MIWAAQTFRTTFAFRFSSSGADPLKPQRRRVRSTTTSRPLSSLSLSLTVLQPTTGRPPRRRPARVGRRPAHRRTASLRRPRRRHAGGRRLCRAERAGRRRPFGSARAAAAPPVRRGPGPGHRAPPQQSRNYWSRAFRRPGADRGGARAGEPVRDCCRAGAREPVRDCCCAGARAGGGAAGQRLKRETERFTRERERLTKTT